MPGQSRTQPSVTKATAPQFRANAPARAQGIDDLQRSFERPPDDAKIMMRWWWFGPAITKSELEREMRLMKEGGIGGFEVQPVYPLLPDNPAAGIRNLPYLSDEFIDALRFTSTKARELGLDFALTSSCYDPAPTGEPCRSCDSCLLREIGFREAGLSDPLVSRQTSRSDQR